MLEITADGKLNGMLLEGGTLSNLVYRYWRAQTCPALRDASRLNLRFDFVQRTTFLQVSDDPVSRHAGMALRHSGASVHP